MVLCRFLAILPQQREIMPDRTDRLSKCAAAFIVAAGLAGVILPAQAVSLGGDPYIKAPPYQPPPLSAMPSAPLGGLPPPHSAASHPAYNPPPLMPPHYKKRNFSRQPQHELWCRQNHPSYNQTDNSYRPFDRAGTMPPQGRVQCISPGD